MPPDFGIGYTDKGSVVLLPAFMSGELASLRLLDRAIYLWLAQRANHAPFTKELDGLTLTVQRGEWFGSRDNLSADLGVDRKTLARTLEALTFLGAVTVENIERQQRYKKGTLNGGEKGPMNGGKFPTQRSGNRTDVRCLGTLVKVHGWQYFRLPKVLEGNGGKFPPQVSTTATVVRAPRLSAAQRAINDQALAAVRSGAL